MRPEIIVRAAEPRLAIDTQESSHVGTPHTVSEIRSAQRRWTKQVLTQALQIVVGTVIGSVILDFRLFTRAFEKNELHLEMLSTSEIDDYAVIVTAGTLLIGAITIAIVAAPRVIEAQTLFDQIALYKWTKWVTQASQVMASLCLATSLIVMLSRPDEGGFASPVGILLMVLSIAAAMLASVTVLRVQDTRDSQVVRLELVTQDRGQRYLRAYWAPRKSVSLKGLLAACLVYLVVPVVGVACWSIRTTALRDDPVNALRAFTVVSILLLCIYLTVLLIFAMARVIGLLTRANGSAWHWVATVALYSGYVAIILANFINESANFTDNLKVFAVLALPIALIYLSSILEPLTSLVSFETICRDWALDQKRSRISVLKGSLSLTDAA